MIIHKFQFLQYTVPCCAKVKYPPKRGVLNIAYNPMMASMLQQSTPFGGYLTLALAVIRNLKLIRIRGKCVLP